MESGEKKAIAEELARTIMRFKKLDGPHISFKGVKRSEFFLLATLAYHSPPDSQGIKISDLSAKMDITPPAVTHMINSLEEMGLVMRLADSGDRRVVLVSLTTKGEEVVKKIQEEFLDKLIGLVEFLGEKDSKEFIRLLSLNLAYHKEMCRQNIDE